MVFFITGTRVLERIQNGWMNWKKVSELLCDRKIRKRTKKNVFKSVVIYGNETRPMKRALEKSCLSNVVVLRMLE